MVNRPADVLGETVRILAQHEGPPSEPAAIIDRPHLALSVSFFLPVLLGLKALDL